MIFIWRKINYLYFIKDIININDGTKIGNIVDVKINESNGAVDALVVERSGFSFNIFSQRGELDIRFNQIEKFGEDVIIVRLENI